MNIPTRGERLVAATLALGAIAGCALPTVGLPTMAGSTTATNTAGANDGRVNSGGTNSGATPIATAQAPADTQQNTQDLLAQDQEMDTYSSLLGGLTSVFSVAADGDTATGSVSAGTSLPSGEFAPRPTPPVNPGPGFGPRPTPPVHVGPSFNPLPTPPIRCLPDPVRTAPPATAPAPTRTALTPAAGTGSALADGSFRLAETGPAITAASFGGKVGGGVAITGLPPGDTSPRPTPPVTPGPSFDPRPTPPIMPGPSFEPRPTPPLRGPGDCASVPVFKERLADAAEARLKTREAAQKQAAEHRQLADAERNTLKQAARNVKWVDNGDGTKTGTVEFDVSKVLDTQTVSRHVKISRTMRTDTHDLLSEDMAFAVTLPNGSSRSTERTKALQADASYLATFRDAMTFADGSTRVASWQKTIGSDGLITGSGTMVLTDATGQVVKTVNVTLKGKDDAPQATGGAPAEAKGKDDAPQATGGAPAETGKAQPDSVTAPTATVGGGASTSATASTSTP